MTNLTEQNSFDAGIYQLEETDPVKAGAGGIANEQAQGLSNRTRWLYNQVQSILTALASMAGLNSPEFSGTPTVPAPAAGDSSSAIVNSSWVTNARGGVAVVDVSAGGTITLTPQQYGVGIIALEGAMTADTTIVVPSTGKWIFERYATGDFTCTVQGKNLASSAVIPAASYGLLVYTDGTNTRLIQGNSSGRLISRVSCGGSQSVPFPAGSNFVRIRQVGGGAGGMHCQTQGAAGALTYASGPGGGAGGYAEWESSSAGATEVTVVVGDGGGSDTSGKDTVVTIAGTSVTTEGGQVGTWNGPTSSSGGRGGSVTVQGSPAMVISAGGGWGSDGMAGQLIFPGIGGASAFGGGGRAGLGSQGLGTTQASSAGEPALTPGAGGGGAYSPDLENATFYYGGQGATGLVILEFWKL